MDLERSPALTVGMCQHTIAGYLRPGAQGGEDKARQAKLPPVKTGWRARDERLAGWCLVMGGLWGLCSQVFCPNAGKQGGGMSCLGPG